MLEEPSGLVVQHFGADLEQEVSALGRAAHLLLLIMRLLTWLTVDSTKALEIVSPDRYLSP
jgi:hypothetical protein